MTIASSVIRPFWMPGLNSISSAPMHRLSRWINNQEYTVTNTLFEKDSFILDIQNSKDLISAFAFDCNRMASASFETMLSIYRIQSSPKAAAWLIIQSYYAAFFAAHSIMRILGVSCSYLKQAEVNKVTQIAQLFSVDAGVNIAQGYYHCIYSNSTQQLMCKNLSSAKGGSHEVFWKCFYSEIKELSNKILSNSKSVTSVSQDVVNQLDNLCNSLCHKGCNSANWLSSIRNIVNYQHELNVWFPYNSMRNRSIDKLYASHASWKTDPMEIDFRLTSKLDLQLFQQTCSFLVSLCRVLVEDISSRCPTGTSFFQNRAMKLMLTWV